MKRILPLAVAALFLIGELAWPLAGAKAESAAPEEAVVDLFDAMQDGSIEAKFVARDSKRGRIILTNNTQQPVNVAIPDAFIGIPQIQGQFGGGGGMGGGMGGGQQSVGGGGGGGFGGGRGGGGRGGGGRGGGGGGGGRRGGFNVPPEKVVRIDVPLLCLDHGLREPSTNKPYVIRPIENYLSSPAVIEIVAAYANGDLPTGAAQAAVWNLNSEVSWEELASKLTGTERNAVRQPYFNSEEIQAAMAIVHHAETTTAGQVVEPREFELPGEGDDVAKTTELAAESDEAEQGEEADATEADAESEAEASDAESDASAATESAAT